MDGEKGVGEREDTTPQTNTRQAESQSKAQISVCTGNEGQTSTPTQLWGWVG